MSTVTTEQPAGTIQPIRIQISVLCGPERHHWLHPNIATALLQWSMDPRVQPDIGGLLVWRPIYGKSTSQEARNAAARMLLADTEDCCDWLLMIDNDMEPIDPYTHQIVNLIDLASTEFDLVAAAAPTVSGETHHGQSVWLHGINAYTRHENAFRMLSFKELTTGPHVQRGNVQLKAVDAVGFGAVCIHRNLVAALATTKFTYAHPASPIPIHSYDGNTPFLRTRDVDGSTIFGEDLLFSWRAWDYLHIQPYCAVSHFIDHHHSVSLGSLPMFQSVVSPAERDDKIIEKWKRYGVTVSVQELHRTNPTGLRYYPALTPWSIQPEVIQRCLSYRPQNILELGCGASTTAFHHASNSQLVFSLEENQEYALAWEGVRVVALGEDGFYEQAAVDEVYQDLADERAKLDLLLVDGPSGKHHARHYAARFLDAVRAGGLVVMDDADRHEEQAACETWVALGLVQRIERVGRAMFMRRTHEPVPQHIIY